MFKVILDILRYVAYLEFINLAVVIVTNSFAGRLWTDPLQGHSLVFSQLVRGIFRMIAKIPVIILKVIITILQIPITIVWSFIPGLSWVADPPNIASWV